MKVPDLYQIYKDKAFDEKSLLGMVVNSQMFCDSDKYSFCLAMQSLPADQQTFMRSKLNGEDSIFNDIKISENPTEQKINYIQRQYIHNLYRFYKLWKFKQEMQDIFREKLDFWNNPLLRPLILKGTYHGQIADYLFSKGYMQEAAELYESLSQQNPANAETWQKLGFAYQKSKLYDKAVKAYLQADTIKPNHLWTLKHLAQCHKLSGDYSQAAFCFQKVLEFVPFGGRTQRSPAQAMAALLPVLPGEKTAQGSVMAWGCDPDALSADPYRGAHDAVYTSVAKLVAAGADYHKAYLSLQEFFEKLRNEPARWGKPFAALLGALDAQLELSAAAIGGKDSMSGSFLDRDVPPTLISFAIAPLLEGELLTTDLKAVGHGVYLFAGKTPEQQTAAWERFTALARAGKVVSAWAVENGLAEAVMKMSFGNEIGFAAENTVLDWFAPMPGAIVAELSDEVSDAVRIGVTTAEKAIALGADSASIEELAALNDAVLEAVYPTKTRDSGTVESFSHETKTRVAPAVKQVRPKALIPVFPGTNCEYDTQRALSEAGADAEQFIVRNLTSADVADSVERFAAAVRTAQMIVIPGGFSGGDEPDGSAKLITAFFRNAAVREQVTALLEQRDGLMLGICNGFQALIKLGLVPYGRIMDTDESFPTLTYNVIGRHQSKLVRTRVCSTRSPWLAGTEVGDIYTVPISHGEGRFLASQELIEQLAANGQIATQYAGLDGYATMDTAFNPNGSVCAIEGITSPDGRVFGKMGHSERIGPALYRNVPGTYDMHLFASAVRYFKK